MFREAGFFKADAAGTFWVANEYGFTAFIEVISELGRGCASRRGAARWVPFTSGR
jgi:hypothetical protein